ncbi:chlorohydrolase [Streptococcus pneumoniae]|uniref:hypothetical protein n=1 Tax=Streptococcus pneumoniae TaxID=1313 RepID=UPI000B6EBB93|nr:hypothetical protein [Streptococcus pneumoniae]SNJ72356.1 chlorohydrolase [Streptococcus pneumoniae]
MWFEEIFEEYVKTLFEEVAIRLTKSAQNSVLKLGWKLTRFEEIFEEYKSLHNKTPDTMRFFNFKDFLQLLLTHIKLF